MSLLKLDASNRVRFSKEARWLVPSGLFQYAVIISLITLTVKLNVT